MSVHLFSAITLPTFTCYADTPEWHAHRELVVTGTWVAAIMGMSPWKSREDAIFRYRMGSSFEMNRHAWWGRYLEKKNLFAWADFTGYVVDHANAFFKKGLVGATVDGFGWFGGERLPTPAFELTTAPTYWKKGLDRLEEAGVRSGKPFLVEMKNTGEKNRTSWGKRPPEHYWAQVQAQLYCTGLDTAVLVAKLGSADMRHHVIQADTGFHKDMVSAIVDFWEDV